MAPQFLELLIDAVFKPGSKINQEHKSKYIYLLAYASSVCDTWNYKRNTRDEATIILPTQIKTFS